ncbi:MAG: hypothetical protein K2H45_09820 [Acetatifactor sp.]|nr:hypothetical protein [Acetatifactor sp.]
MGNKSEIYEQALEGKKVPVLTLDNKWYKLFRNLDEEPQIKALESQLNDLLKRQGQLNVDSKNIKKLKRKLMEDIVPMANQLEQSYSKSVEKKLEENKRLIAECNEKLEEYQNQLLDFPGEIGRVNHALMLATMEYCYDSMQENTQQIVEIAQWVKYIRIELKKNLVRKQEMEYQNRQIYSYMHDLFGADVIDLFDMQYDPLAVEEKKAAAKEAESDKK